MPRSSLPVSWWTGFIPGKNTEVLKEKYGGQFYVVAVWSSPEDRYKRLSRRKVRPLTPEQARSRDYAEIENMNKGGPICMADFTILNDADMGALENMSNKSSRG